MSKSKKKLWSKIWIKGSNNKKSKPWNRKHKDSVFVNVDTRDILCGFENRQQDKKR